MSSDNYNSDNYVDDREHVFIVGSGRCGTTLLASILFDSGMYAVYRAETKLLDECPPKYGSLVSSRAYSKFKDDWFNSRQFHRSGLTVEEFDEAVSDYRGSYLQILGRFMGAVASKQKKRLWIEDTPSNAFRLMEISQAFPNARVIHIIRDGRAVALSMTKLGWTGVHTGNYRKGLCYSALKWEQSVQAIINTSRSLHDHYHEIMYEDLVTDPQTVISKLGIFLNINLTADSILNSGKDDGRSSQSQSALNTPNTAFGDVGSGISSKPAYRWREQMSRDDQALLNSYIGNTLMHYRYPVTFRHDLGFTGNATRHFRALVLGSKRAIKHHTYLGRITRSPLEINQA